MEVYVVRARCRLAPQPRTVEVLDIVGFGVEEVEDAHSKLRPRRHLKSQIGVDQRRGASAYAVVLDQRVCAEASYADRAERAALRWRPRDSACDDTFERSGDVRLARGNTGELDVRK